MSECEVAAFNPPDLPVLLQYHREVFAGTREYLTAITEEDLDKEMDIPMFPTVAARISGFPERQPPARGQVAYLRGLLKGKGWLKI
ncbi:hypothetical protein ACFLV2_01410 [Chloroflexota bacterium]